MQDDRSAKLSPLGSSTGALPASANLASRIAGLATCLGIRDLFERQAVREGYSVGEHSLMALQQRAKYFPAGLPHMGPELTDVFISLHDAGKRVERDTKQQSRHTIRLIQEHAAKIGIDETSVSLFCALLSRDPIGSCIVSITPTAPTATDKLALGQALTAGTLTEATLLAFQQRTVVTDARVELVVTTCEQQVREMAHGISMRPADFLATLLRYYQIDASSYTVDAARDLSRTFPNRELSTTTAPIDVRNPELCMEYAALEQRARPARGYPSLDGLFVLHPDFRLTDSPTAVPAFLFDNQRNRLVFSAGIEAVIRRLEAQLQG